MMSRNPRVSISLRDYVAPNYARAKMLDICGVKVWFSYETPIATVVDNDLPVVTREPFSPTTARHKQQIAHLKESVVGIDNFDACLRANLNEAIHRLRKQALERR